MTLPVIIVGGGGHSKVLIEALRLRSVKILGITECDNTRIGIDVLGIGVIGNDDKIFGYAPESIRLVNGVGSVNLPKARKAVFDKFKERGFTFATIIHPSAVIASDVVLGEGAQVMAGAVIQPGSRIGRNSIVNTRVSVDHDCSIGEHVHLAPGVTLSGSVRVGDIVHIGTGAIVIQGMSIGHQSIIGAGSVVLEPVVEGTTVLGCPARPISPHI
jgi:sugar O-acyltransferase (sialic acid O-acetyltransferase NeuD family)